MLRNGQTRDREPIKGVDDIGSLIDPNLHTFTVIGTPPRELRPAVSLALYRITQEALTNARRYGLGEVKITLMWEVGAVDLRIANPYTGERNEPGHGITGMRRRAELAGGTLRIDTTGSQWVVSASFDMGEEQ